MRFLSHLFLSFIFNLVAILAADYLIQEFTVNGGIRNYIVIASLLTLINTTLKPFLKLLLTPIIILTLGLFTVLINAALIYGLDKFLESFTIEGLIPLLYATLLISTINFVLHFFDHRLNKKV